MQWGLPRRASLRGQMPVLWLCWVLFYTTGAKGELFHAHSTLSVTASHLHYTCPEGSTVKLMCSQRGTALHPTDILKYGWLFTPHSDQHCSVRLGPRHVVINSHGNHTLPPGLHFGVADQNFWVVLQNLTQADQGRYCCMIRDLQVEHQHGTLVQRPHGHIVLQIKQRGNGFQNCTSSDPTPPGGSVPVALAVAACILALLSLPLILLLVYKQRQIGPSRRRAQELVRMDSEAHGHENPVFLGGSPQIKTRTVSQIMTRQSSETGRHLLSEPGTPLSPPAHGEMLFFPIEDTIHESPELLQI